MATAVNNPIRTTAVGEFMTEVVKEHNLGTLATILTERIANDAQAWHTEQERHEMNMPTVEMDYTTKGCLTTGSEALPVSSQQYHCSRSTIKRRAHARLLLQEIGPNCAGCTPLTVQELVGSFDSNDDGNDGPSPQFLETILLLLIMMRDGVGDNVLTQSQATGGAGVGVACNDVDSAAVELEAFLLRHPLKLRKNIPID
jgi:hypothetical protein